RHLRRRFGRPRSRRRSWTTRRRRKRNGDGSWLSPSMDDRRRGLNERDYTTTAHPFPNSSSGERACLAGFRQARPLPGTANLPIGVGARRRWRKGADRAIGAPGGWQPEFPLMEDCHWPNWEILIKFDPVG